MTAMTDFAGIDADAWQRLLEAALAARTRAYAPYSKFQVGASILHDDDEIVVGVNVENATYGATCCAERTAVQTSVTDGRSGYRALCVVTQAERAVAPCGICRQVLAEFAPNMPILIANLDGAHEFMTLGELLPHQFNKSDL